MQNAPKLQITAPISYSRWPNTTAMSTKVFFIHCRGRIPSISAKIMARRSSVCHIPHAAASALLDTTAAGPPAARWN